MVIDIAALEPVPVDNPSSVIYGYKFFGRTNDPTTDTTGALSPNLGTGQFFKNALGTGVPPLLGEEFGVNAFNRTGQTLITDADWTNKTVQGSTVGSPAPDVFFVRWQGGRVYDPDTGNNNVYAVVENSDPETTQGQAEAYLELRIAGITPSGAYIGVHPFANSDFFDGITGGILLTPFSYNVYLDYQGLATPYQIPGVLTVASMPTP
jgi:hypothetical protein